MIRIGVTHHGAMRLRQRLGRGCDVYSVARRCWTRNQEPPEEWEVPRMALRKYLRYGDCLFIFGPPPFEKIAGKFSGQMWLITVVGPFAPGRKWEKKMDI